MRLAEELLIIKEASSKHPYGSPEYYEAVIAEQKERLVAFKKEMTQKAKSSLGRLNQANVAKTIREWEARIKVLEKKLIEAGATKK